MKIDMHTHTCHSSDSDMQIGDLIDAAKKRGLDGVVVVDHGTLDGAKEALQKAEGTGLVVIRGEEIKTRSGEILALGISRTIEEKQSLLETCEQVKRQGGFIVVPHPFDVFRSGLGAGIERVAGFIDAVEVFNSRTLFDRFNRKAADFAFSHGLPAVAGSDAHFPSEVGNAYIQLECVNQESGIFEAIRTGRIKIFTKKSGFRRYPKTLSLKIRRLF